VSTRSCRPSQKGHGQQRRARVSCERVFLSLCFFPKQYADPSFPPPHILVPQYADPFGYPMPKANRPTRVVTLT
jgi:hypothetical protein